MCQTILSSNISSCVFVGNFFRQWNKTAITFYLHDITTCRKTSNFPYSVASINLCKLYKTCIDVFMLISMSQKLMNGSIIFVSFNWVFFKVREKVLYIISYLFHCSYSYHYVIETFSRFLKYYSLHTLLYSFPNNLLKMNN